MLETPLAPHRVEAYNTAFASENKIHDDTVARRFGFSGGLVPGVDVYAYMTHLPVARWGRAWLDRGSAECRFLKPIYDGHMAVVTAAATGGGLDLAVESEGELCANGQASMREGEALPDPDRCDPLPPRAVREPADEHTLAPETSLGIAPFRLTPEYAAQYLGDVRETHALYAREGLCHPGTILRLCNWALTHNVLLGPWIHTGSKVQHLAAAHVGDELTLRARIVANYERRGHRFVELDVLVLANRLTPIAQVAHTAIYRPRQVT